MPHLWSHTPNTWQYGLEQTPGDKQDFGVLNMEALYILKADIV
jgi:hypothetical protein